MQWVSEQVVHVELLPLNIHDSIYTRALNLLHLWYYFICYKYPEIFRICVALSLTLAL